MKSRWTVLLIALNCLTFGRAFAWNAPEDTAGPLTLRIEAPDEVRETGVPQAVHVVLKNAGASRLEGRVHLGVIDTWVAEPSGHVPFQVDATAETTLDLAVTAGEGAYNALYPIHAFAEFDVDGQTRQAHAVKVVRAQVPNPPRVETLLPWAPVAVAADSILPLATLPMRRVIVQVFNEAPLVLPAGWQGVESRSRASVQCGEAVPRPDARRSIHMHPPWYDGHTGSVAIEFPLQLPNITPIHLTFANAIRDNTAMEPVSDGVTFRVRVVALDAELGVLGDILFERHTDAKTWEDAAVDLSAFAGKTVRLQLEAHPGPKNNTTCDQCYWGEPRVAAGTPPDASARRPTGPARALGVIERGGERYAVSVVPGAQGLLDADVLLEHGQDRLLFHGFSVTVSNDALGQPSALSTLKEVAELPANAGYRVRHAFNSWAGSFDLIGELRVEDGVLRARFALANAPDPKPWQVVRIEDVAAGPWNLQARRVYGGTGNVIERPEAFDLGFDGHRLATSFVGFDFDNGMALVQGVNVPPTRIEVTPDAKRYTLHAPLTQTVTFIPCTNVWDGARVWREVNGLKAAGGVARAAGRFVFDLWGGSYASSADALERAFRYGLTDSLVVWHNWQRWGYDYRLPDIYPPNPDLGTLDEFQHLAQVCKDRDVPFAPHDNYIDFYPDAEGFSYRHIAFTQTGQPIPAWLNEGRDAQSYRWRPDAVAPFLDRNLALIRQQIAPTGYFIDVWSSIRPHDYWTQEGRFFDCVYTRARWGQYFAQIRDALGGNAPMISESGHDQLIGWLDGAQTNHLRVDANPPGKSWMCWPIQCADAERVPWFDAAHHDRFILHGAGYSYRYAGGLDGRLHGIYSDDYICTEMLTGHPAMVPEPFGRDAVRKYWLLATPMRALALGLIDAVQFVDDNVHHQYVKWNNGGEVWVNRGVDDWNVGDHVLPGYGFFARVPLSDGAVEAAIERRDGVIVEWNRAPGAVYANARPWVEGAYPIHVAVESFQDLGDRNCKLTFRWDARKPLPEDCTIFVHGVDGEGDILFQGDHVPATPTSQWNGMIQTSTRVQLPKTAAPGTTYEVRVGLYVVPGGKRYAIEGPSDGQQRIRLGTIAVTDTGATWTPLETGPDPFLARINPEGKSIAFGGVTTNGACRIAVEADAVVVTPLPGGPAFSVELDWNALGWQTPLPQAIQAVAEDGTALDRTPLQAQGRVVAVPCAPGVFAYRLVAE